MKDYEPDLMTFEQLKTLGYDGKATSKNHEKPLLVCDVDEVVLHLVDPFVAVLEERGFTLKSHSFKLTGNVFDAKTGREATQDEVWSGLTQLFEEQDKRQGLVDGVVKGLNDLSDHPDIIFLTNMPHPFGDIRRNYLKENGLDFPLVTNTRSKVPAIQHLQSHCSASIGFIDDTPTNLNQVREGVDDVHLFHFMANEDFRALAGPIDGIHFSSGDWVETSEKIRHAMMENT